MLSTSSKITFSCESTAQGFKNIDLLKCTKHSSKDYKGCLIYSVCVKLDVVPICLSNTLSEPHGGTVTRGARESTPSRRGPAVTVISLAGPCHTLHHATFAC